MMVPKIGTMVEFTLPARVVALDCTTAGGPFVAVKLSYRPAPENPVQRPRIWLHIDDVSADHAGDEGGNVLQVGLEKKLDVWKIELESKKRAWSTAGQYYAGEKINVLEGKISAVEELLRKVKLTKANKTRALEQEEEIVEHYADSFPAGMSLSQEGGYEPGDKCPECRADTPKDDCKVCFGTGLICEPMEEHPKTAKPHPPNVKEVVPLSIRTEKMLLESRRLLKKSAPTKERAFRMKKIDEELARRKMYAGEEDCGAAAYQEIMAKREHGVRTRQQIHYQDHGAHRVIEHEKSIFLVPDEHVDHVLQQCLSHPRVPFDSIRLRLRSSMVIDDEGRTTKARWTKPFERGSHDDLLEGATKSLEPHQRINRMLNELGGAASGDLALRLSWLEHAKKSVELEIVYVKMRMTDDA